MRRHWTWLALLLLSCSKKEDDGTVKVGAFLSLSGSDATFGVDLKDGMDLALDEINASGGIKGKKLTIVYEDDKSSNTETSLVVKKLIERDNVSAILGEAVSGRTSTAAVIANNAHVPMITPSATSLDVTKGREWVFRSCFTDDQQGKAAARFVVREMKAKRLGIFYVAQDSYSSGLAQSFRDELAKVGGATVVIDKGYQKGETTFRTQLSEIKGASPDVVFVPSYYTDMVTIARQAKEVGLDGSKLFGADGWDASNLLEGAGAELEGASFTDHYAAELPGPVAQRFLDGFKKKLGRAPASGHALGYDSVLLLADAMKRAPDGSRDAIRRMIAETKGFEGATGTIAIDAEHNAAKPVVVVRIAQKHFAYRAKIE